MILATCQHHHLKPYTFQSEFRIVYCCLVKLGCHKSVFSFISDDECDARIDRESAELRERARREGWWGGDQARMIYVCTCLIFGADEIALSGPFTSYDKVSVCAN